MTFAYPLGLLGLIAIPVLILIYIIKSMYTEQTVASTYLWNLSEKFLRRRAHKSIIAGLISLILQILIVILVSFAISQPVITFANSAHSYCFILDGSGSMNFVQGRETRFDIAKREIINLIDDSVSGSKYTLIYAGSTVETIFENQTDKKTVKQIIGETSVGYVQSDMDEALGIAQEYFNADPSVLTYLVTDTHYEAHKNVKLINVSKAAANYAIESVTYGISGRQLKISGTALSYGGEELLLVNLYFDGLDEIYDSKLVLAGQVGTDFEFMCNRTEFESFKVEIADKDALALDSQVVVFDVYYENISDVLLVSDNPFFIRAALVSSGVANVETVSTEKYSNKTGYGLYIFDSFIPRTMPDDGAVWFFNPQGNLAGTNFSYQNEITSLKDAAIYADPDKSSLISTLLEGVTGQEFELKKYIKCGLNGRFTPLITCGGNPLLFVGNNTFGNREVVFAFDVRDSAQFTLFGDFSILVKNLIGYSFPSIIEDTFYYCGDILQINIVANIINIRIDTPEGRHIYPDTSVDVCEYRLEEAGVYSIVLIMKDRSERTLNVFSALPEEERQPLKEGNEFSIIGVSENSQLDGYFDPLFYICIVLIVLIVADFGVYSYEQYQLR